MKTKEKIWEERKKYFINRLNKELKERRVDEDILELLKLINSLKNFYTLSSCSGRIQILEGKFLGKRKELKSLAKFHSGLKTEEFKKIIKETKGKYCWISLQPPIIHIACKTLEDAIEFLKVSRECGFKHSGIQALNIDRYIIELNSSIRLDIPIKYDGKFIINEENYEKIINILNENLFKIKNSLNLLKKKIEKKYLINFI